VTSDLMPHIPYSSGAVTDMVFSWEQQPIIELGTRVEQTSQCENITHIVDDKVCSLHERGTFRDGSVAILRRH
jgi:hypothetical protein